MARIRERDAALSFIHSDKQGDFDTDIGLLSSCTHIVRGLP